MNPLLVIDAGHGGLDTGTICDLFTEKAMNIQISLYQAKRCEELGVPYLLTRKDDETLSADERSKRVRESGAEVCISNHINAGGGEGAETIFSIFADGKLANSILDALVEEGAKRRRVFCRKHPDHPGQDFYFMHRLTGKVETVIVEYGFADNENDKKKISVLWRVYAEAVLRAVCQYKGWNYTPPKEHEEPYDPLKDLPKYKREGIEFLYSQGLLIGEEWKLNPDEPFPIWAEGLILKRFMERLKE